MFFSKLEKFKKEIKNIKLSETERADIKRSVLNFISKNPRKVNFSNDFKYYPASFSLLNFSHSSAFSLLLVLCVILVGGGISLAAEKSLPGDVLYPFKVQVNEEFVDLLPLPVQIKADWEIKRVSRRLEEAEELASQESLNTETRSRIEANFEDHAEKVRDRIEKFEAEKDFKSAIDISSKLENSLNTHQQILNRIQNEAESHVQEEVEPIRNRVRLRADDLSETKRNIELRLREENNLESSGNYEGSVGGEKKEEDTSYTNYDKSSSEQPEMDYNSDDDDEEGSSQAEDRLRARLRID